MGKVFLLSPEVKYQDKSVIKEGESRKEAIVREHGLSINKKSKEKISEEDNLRHLEGRVVVKIDVEYKNKHTFSSGLTIDRPRQFNNFNKRETEPVNAVVISGTGIDKDSEILVHPNSIHDSNRIFDYKDSNDNIRYYSIQNDMCFAWYDENKQEWKGIYPYELALRVFIPYSGALIGIEPKVMKDTLFVLTGELKNKVVRTLVACDYECVYQGRNGQEQSLIRFRPFGEPKLKREEEAIAILNDVTEKVLSGKYLVGYTISDAKLYTNE